jgi:hypothetical protein
MEYCVIYSMLLNKLFSCEQQHRHGLKVVFRTQDPEDGHTENS